MATQQSRKRQHAHKALPNEHRAKRLRRDYRGHAQSPAERVDSPVLGHYDFGHYDSWHYPPEFWDRLSTIPLVRQALEELDRRNHIQPAFPSPPPSPPTGLARGLARFARHGGPDLRDLRGYPAPAVRDHRSPNAMSSSSQSRPTKSMDPTYSLSFPATAACTSRTSYKTVVRNLIRPILLEGRPYASLLYVTKADGR